MQTKHKASPAFDTLSLGALAPELAKYQQEPPQWPAAPSANMAICGYVLPIVAPKAPSMKWKERCHCWFKSPLLG